MKKKATTPKRAPKIEAAFWLVWKDAYYERVPNWRHSTEEAARKEAERLAAQFPGSRFYVLPASEYAFCDVRPVAWERAQPELPFTSSLSEETPF